jgi:hypothetical protein
MFKLESEPTKVGLATVVQQSSASTGNGQRYDGMIGDMFAPALGLTPQTTGRSKSLPLVPDPTVLYQDGQIEILNIGGERFSIYYADDPNPPYWKVWVTYGATIHRKGRSFGYWQRVGRDGWFWDVVPIVLTIQINDAQGGIIKEFHIQFEVPCPADGPVQIFTSQPMDTDIFDITSGCTRLPAPSPATYRNC